MLKSVVWLETGDGAPLMVRSWRPGASAGEGPVRAAVVVCPPVGVEAQAARRALHVLAERLAEAGFVAVTFDWEGTGGSADGPRGGKIIQRWQSSLLRVVQSVREGGAASVFVAGMRLGATVAASVAASLPLDGLVLWDPCESGRSYLREEALLRSVYLKDQGVDEQAAASVLAPGDVEVLGEVYDAAAAEAICALDLSQVPGPMAPSVLVLARPERPLRRAVRRRLAAEDVEEAPASGQERLLSIWPLLAEVPEVVIATVTAWVGAKAPRESRPFEPPGTAGPVAVSPVAVSPVPVSPQPTEQPEATGQPQVTEQIVSIGPYHLFGVLSRPAGSPVTLKVAMLTSGRMDSSGPGRLWVYLARRWAAQGVAVLRADIGGLGDSAPRPGQPVDAGFPANALEDVGDIAAALSNGEVLGLPGPEVPTALVGLCSGAWHSLAAVASGKAHADAIVPINPFLPADRADHKAAAAKAAERAAQPVPGDDGAARATAPSPPAGLGGRARASARTATSWAKANLLATDVKEMGHWVLDAKWWALGRLGRRERSVGYLRGALANGSRVLLACRTYEAYLIMRGERAVLRQLARSGRFRIEVFPGTDHTLLVEHCRRAVLPDIEQYLLGMRAGTDERGSSDPERRPSEDTRQRQSRPLHGWDGVERPAHHRGTVTPRP